MKYLLSLLGIPLLCCANNCELAKNAGYADLRNSGVFTSARNPPWYAEYACILCEPEREMFFDSTLATTTVAGQLYALKGLREIRSNAIAGPVSKYRSDPTEVQTLLACVGSRASVSDIVRRIKPTPREVAMQGTE